MVNPFFKNTGPHNINFLLKTVNLKNLNLPDDQITDIKDLNSSQKNEITFFHSKRYVDLAKKTMHSTASEAAKIASAANVGKLILGHFSNRYKNQENFIIN